VRKIGVFLTVLSVVLVFQCHGNKTIKAGKTAKVDVVATDADNEKSVASEVGSSNPEKIAPAPALPLEGNNANTKQKSAEPERTLTPDELKERNLELEERVSELKELNKSLKNDKEKFKDESEKAKKEVEKVRNTVAGLERDVADSRAQKEGFLMEKDRFKRQSEQNQQKIASIAAFYRDKSFDDLIGSTTKQIVERDMAFFEKNSKEERILADLRTYFDAKGLFEQKYDAVKISGAQTGLGKIERPSELLEALAEDLGKYRDCGESLKKAMNAILDVDKSERSNRVPEMQERKFNKIAVILGNYMSKNYDCVKFPSLSDIVSKIMQRKGINADADIEDLQRKLP
jgi:DNA repair exonuclease SbcCD ATPase subunit